jgi:hypothetical protein
MWLHIRENLLAELNKVIVMDSSRFVFMKDREKVCKSNDGMKPYWVKSTILLGVDQRKVS